MKQFFSFFILCSSLKKGKPTLAVTDLKKKSQKSKKYILQKYQRSNQDTLIFQRPLVREGEWIQSGDIVADCSTSLGGELCLGKNICIAYMPWEGYNYEDAILISQRLVSEDVYTSIHIESYEVETRNTKFGKEQFTKQIPDVSDIETHHLDERGIVKLGTSVKEGDILVGKVTPIQKKFQSPYEKLLYTILEKDLLPMRDSSLRTPKGLKAKVLEIKILSFSNEKFEKTSKKNLTYPNLFLDFNPFFSEPFERFPFSFSQSFLTSFAFQKTFFSSIFIKNKESLHKIFKKKTKNEKKNQKNDSLHLLWEASKVSNKNKKNLVLVAPCFFLNHLFLEKKKKSNKKTENSFVQYTTVTSGKKNFMFFRPSGFLKKNQKMNKHLLFSKDDFQFLQKNPIWFFQKKMKKMETQKSFFSIALFKKKQTFPKILENKRFLSLKKKNQFFAKFSQQEKKNKVFENFENFQKKPEKVQVYLVEKRKIQVGDKMSGRHGNKGIVSQILPVPDMPFLPDGTALDMVLNPLGVPSRMNVGQIYECILGLASKYLHQYYRIQPFDEIYGPQASRSFTFSKLYEARKKTSQKWLFNPCFPGKMYIFDGRTGEPYENPVTVGISYILKLVHLVDDKIHARSTGPYSLVTQQPLRGRSKYGGQRLGEMEVWAIEAYGAAFILLEMLTLKSDDISGRMTLWSNILLNMPIYIGTPESFKVLVCELQALCLDMGLYRFNKKGFLTQIEHLMQLP